MEKIGMFPFVHLKLCFLFIVSSIAYLPQCHLNGELRAWVSHLTIADVSSNY